MHGILSKWTLSRGWNKTMSNETNEIHHEGIPSCTQ